MGPRQLTLAHKAQGIRSTQEFLERFRSDGDNFLKPIMTGGET